MTGLRQKLTAGFERWRNARSMFAALALLPLVSSGPVGVGRAVGAVAAGAVIVGRFGLKMAPRRWIVVGVLGVVSTTAGPRWWYGGTAYHAVGIALALGGVLLVALAGTRPKLAMRLAVAASLLALALAVANDPGGMLDVGIMHRAGGQAVVDGESPWTGLRVPSGVPGSEASDVVDGDPYPPVALLSYLAFDLLTGEPRAAGAVGWLVFVVAVGFVPRQDPRPLILLVTSGTLPLLLWTGWTEMITLALLATSVALWRRTSVVSALSLGLALASKQYMVVVAPLLVRLRAPDAAARLWITGVVAMAGAGSGFLLGEGYLDAIVGAYADFEPRRDSASMIGLLALFGLEPDLPSWVGPVAGAGTALLLARNGVAGLEGLLTTTAKSLAVLFVLGTQAFSNYWFLVFALLLFASAMTGPAPTATDGASIGSRASP